MHEKRNLTMRILGYLFLFGGVVRLFADENLFELFYMQDAWTDHPYFIYIYRVLGAFVILTGLLIIRISRDPAMHREIMYMLMWGFLVIGGVMLVTGILADLPIYLFALDALFVFILAILFDRWRKQAN